jgi:hypothetical protein
VTASEFAFLAMGLVLGIAAGAALIEVVRARPTAHREVRVTMTADAIPRRRAATLANDAFTEARIASEPARGGPADRRDLHAEAVDEPTERRTPVHVPRPGTIVEPAFRLTGPMPSAPVMAGDGRGPAGALSVATAATAMPVSSGVDPMLTALRASAAASAEAAMRSATTPTPDGSDAGTKATGMTTLTATAVAEEERPSPVAPTVSDRPQVRVRSEQSRSKTGSSRTSKAAAPAPSAPAGSPASPDAPGGDDGGPCAEPRRIADERCELATRARAQATEAEGAHRAAQREYDDHETAAAEAAAESDPRAVRQRKDEAQARFREGRAVATTNQEVDAAARAWLLEINEINSRAARAATTLAKAHSGAQEFAVRLERTAVAADAARISAEAAEATCLAARQAVAYCEEQASLGTLGILPQMPPPSGDDGETGTKSDALAAAMRSGASPRIVRLLRGDRAAMQELVAAIAGDSADDRRHWQSALSDLVDAILADSIASSALEFPLEHAFWGPFTRAQSRDITGALASLGYRFDGLGGWIDDRVPSQRDLSLALGYAGLDPMRMRHWPSEEEMETLFSEVQVAAAEHLAGAAGDLTLGELVSMLGRRADGLTEVWNSWGRIRPLMLDET